MKPEIKEKWLAALRSGEYRKARGQLCKVNPTNKVKGHCCLGVLRDVVRSNEPDSHGYLSASTRQHVRMSVEDQECLIGLNDKGSGWDKVIDYIEEEM